MAQGTTQTTTLAEYCDTIDEGAVAGPGTDQVTVIPPEPPEDLLWELGEHPLVVDLFCGVGGTARTFTSYGH